jgi:hypothetical protein
MITQIKRRNVKMLMAPGAAARGGSVSATIS